MCDIKKQLIASFLIFLMGLLSPRALAQGEKSFMKDFENDLSRIDKLTDVNGLDDSAKQHRVEELQALGTEIERVWLERDFTHYADLMPRICQFLESTDLSTNRRLP
jgi:hypothetical protein